MIDHPEWYISTAISSFFRGRNRSCRSSKDYDPTYL